MATTDYILHRINKSSKPIANPAGYFCIFSGGLDKKYGSEICLQSILKVTFSVPFPTTCPRAMSLKSTFIR